MTNNEIIIIILPAMWNRAYLRMSLTKQNGIKIREKIKPILLFYILNKKKLPKKFKWNLKSYMLWIICYIFEVIKKIIPKQKENCIKNNWANIQYFPNVPMTLPPILIILSNLRNSEIFKILI